MPVAAAAAIPISERVVRKAWELGQTPIMGWERIRAKPRRKGGYEEVRTSFQLRAWEVAALGLTGAVVWLVMQAGGSTPFEAFNPKTGETKTVEVPNIIAWAPIWNLVGLRKGGR